MKKSILLLFLCLPLLFSSCDTKQKEVSPPNILFITVDDLRPELNTYGASYIQSPNIDLLAEEGVQFNRAYCNFASCGASRASVLTGLRPTRNRFISYNTKKDIDAPKAVSLPLIFKKNGYKTISNGKVYHHMMDDKMAWDEIWRPPSAPMDYALKNNIELAQRKGLRGPAYEKANVPDSTYRDGKIALKGIRDLKKLKKEKQPFFLALGFVKPHLPFNAPNKYWDLYDPKKINLPDNFVQPPSTPKKAFHTSGELRKYHDIPPKGHFSDELSLQLIHGYYAAVSYVDAQIGKVLNSLERLGLVENTIVVLWGDHGYNLGGHKLFCKHSTFESSLHVPLLIKAPQIKKGQKLNHIVELIDIYPTLCEMAGIKSPEKLAGKSMLTLMQGNTRQKDYAISKFNEAVAIVNDDFLYTEWTDNSGHPYERMLFDHSTDPLEMDNLAEKEKYQKTVEELSSALHSNWGDDYLNLK